jgi:transposase
MGQDTRELWLKRVERWKDSGLSAREFAAEVGINAQTLSYWRWKLGKKVAKAPARKKQVAFVEVVAGTSDELASVGPIVSEPARDQRPEPLEIVLRDELRIRVPVHFDAEALRRVVATLGTC